MADTCATHPTAPAIAECELCGARVCRRCTTYLVDERLACEACGKKRLALAAPRWMLGGVVLAGCVGTTVAFAGVLAPHEIGIALGGSLLLTVRAAMPPSAKRWHVEPWDPGTPLPKRAALSDPYRARRDRAAAREAPRPAVSGKAVAILVGLCLTLATLLVPFALRLPRWVEYEIVLLLWWMLGAATLSAMLYRGWGLRDDHEYERLGLLPRIDVSRMREPPEPGCSAAGCLMSFGEIAVVMGIFLASLVAIEFILPGVAFLAYFLIHGAIARVVNDEHGCEHDVLRSVLWGTFWATLHVAPLALVVWVLHLLVRMKGG